MVMSLDAFMLSRFTTLTPLNGEMLVETKLISFYVKQNTWKTSSTSCIPAVQFIARPKKIIKKMANLFSFSNLCERKIFSPCFRVPFLSNRMVTDHWSGIDACVAKVDGIFSTPD